MITEQEADDYVKKGWLRSLLIFEVIAAKEETTKSAIETHLKKLEDDQRVKIYKKEVSDIIKVEKPTPKIDSAYSIHSEIELVSNSFDRLMQIVIQYGPSSIELLEPKKIELPLNDAQGLLNSVSQLMHQFAAAGIGGFVILKGK